MLELRTMADAIQALDMDTVFYITDDGVQTTHKFHAPEVFHSLREDVEIHDSAWSALSGMTQQYAYTGAVMHSSEIVSTGIAYRLDEMATESRAYDRVTLFTITTVMVHDSEDLAGWVILFQEVASV